MAPVHISIHPADRRPIYLQIIEEIQRAIALGALRTGDPLPSVRQLAADLRINPNTVAQAYRELERDGLVAMRRGQGTYVAGPGSGVGERDALARGVAERALLDAHRHGLDAEELIDAIREAAASTPTPSTPRTPA